MPIPVSKMKPRYPVQPARRQHRQMLQVALAPSPVARGEIQQATAGIPRSCRRAPAPCRIAQPPRRISAASTKSWLRICPPNGLRPGSSGRPGVLREGADADDGVVPPVVAFGAVPPGDAGGDQRPVEPPGELLQPRKQGSRIHDDRQRLDQRRRSGCASIAATSRTMVSPVIRLSASRMIMWS